MTARLRSGPVTIATIAAIAALVAGYVVSQHVLRAQDPKPAMTFVDFSLVDLDGKTRRLSEWRGQTIVLNFWATWCGPCREEIPLFVRLQQRYQSRGVRMIGVAVDNRAAVAAYAKEMHIGYPLLLAEETGLSIMTRYENPSGSLPYTVIIDDTGIVISRKLGAYKENELDSLLAKLVKPNSVAILSN